MKRFIKNLQPISLLLLGAMTWLSSTACPAQENTSAIAAGKGKYLGCIWQPTEKFLPIWNQMTPENAAKWMGIQGKYPLNPEGAANLTQSWKDAAELKIPFKAHTFLWARSVPQWATELKTEAEFKQKVKEWLVLFKKYCPNPAMIDVVNEPFGERLKLAWGKGVKEPKRDDRPEWSTAQPTLTDDQRDELIIWVYKEARAAFPNSQLLINEFNIIRSSAKVREKYIALIKKILAAGPVQGKPLLDGIGIQFHFFETLNTKPEAITAALDEMGALGLDLHISELSVFGIKGDPQLSTEEVQKQRFETVFPPLWTHPKVKGVTLWCYNSRSTFDFKKYGYDGIGLTKMVDGQEVEKSAMIWLRSYIKDNP